MEHNNFEINQVKSLNRFVWQFTMSKDINVPDYMSDIKEILLDNVSVGITEEKLSGDRIYVSGVSSYEILLADEEQEGAVNYLTGDINFNEVIKITGEDDGEFIISSELNEKHITMIHPRKVNISLVITLTAIRQMQLSIPVYTSISSDDNIFCKQEKDTLSSLCYKGYDETLFIEDFSPDDSMPDIDEICYTDYCVKDVYTISHEDGFSLCMTLALLVIYKNYDDEQAISHFTKNISVKSFISCCNTIGQTIFAKPFINHLSITKKDSEDSVKAVCNLNLSMTIYSEIYKQITSDILKDAYACRGELTLDRPTEKLYVPKLIKEDFTVCESFPLEDLDTNGNPLFASLSLQDACALTEGSSLIVSTTLVPCIYFNGKEKLYSVLNKNISNKFSVNLTDEGECEANDIIVYISLKDISFSIADNELTAKCELSASILIKRRYDADFISKVSLDDANPCNKKHITCYFVKENDDLFKIGKKYKVSPREIEAGNPDVSLQAGSKLYLYTSGGEK